MSILSILLVVFVICLVAWATNAIISAFSLTNPLAGCIYVLVVLLLVFWGLGYLGIALPIPLR